MWWRPGAAHHRDGESNPSLAGQRGRPVRRFAPHPAATPPRRDGFRTVQGRRNRAVATSRGNAGTASRPFPERCHPAGRRRNRRHHCRAGRAISARCRVCRRPSRSSEGTHPEPESRPRPRHPRHPARACRTLQRLRARVRAFRKRQSAKRHPRLRDSGGPGRRGSNGTAGFHLLQPRASVLRACRLRWCAGIPAAGSSQVQRGGRRVRGDLLAGGAVRDGRRWEETQTSAQAHPPMPVQEVRGDTAAHEPGELRLCHRQDLVIDNLNALLAGRRCLNGTEIAWVYRMLASAYMAMQDIPAAIDAYHRLLAQGVNVPRQVEARQRSTVWRSCTSFRSATRRRCSINSAGSSAPI